MRTVLECDADRHKFGIYILPKDKDWKTAGDELLYGYTNAFYLGKNDKNRHIQQIQPYIFCGKCKTNGKYRGSINDMRSKGEFVICKNCKEAQHKKCVRFFDKDEDINNYRCCNCSGRRNHRGFKDEHEKIITTIEMSMKRCNGIELVEVSKQETHQEHMEQRMNHYTAKHHPIY